jgi:DNA polymerase-3 subunit delta
MSLHLLRGSDESLLGQSLGQLLHELIGDADRAMVLEDLDGDEWDVTRVVEAAQTPPFLTDRRVVVARGIERFTTADAVAPLVAYLADPLDTTDLVLVSGGGRLPKSLTDAVKQAGGLVTDADAPSGRARQGWVEGHFQGAEVKLDAGAKAAISARLGDDLGRLEALLATLDAAFGRGARLGEADVEPFLGEAGTIPPWELTDAIDRGDVALALDKLHRLMEAGERHPLALMATLTTHYVRMLRLDGAEGVADEASAAAALGLKGSTFPARKALDQLRRLGSKGVARAVELLAQADLDLRGRRDLPEALVMEVLVARLAVLSPPAARGRALARSGRR